MIPQMGRYVKNYAIFNLYFILLRVIASNAKAIPAKAAAARTGIVYTRIVTMAGLMVSIEGKVDANHMATMKDTIWVIRPTAVLTA